MVAEIKVISQVRKINIIANENKLFVNGVEKNIDAEDFLSRLVCIVTPWEHKMVNFGILDGETYSVKLISKEDVVEYYGKNKFPRNYDSFINLLKEVM